MGSVASGAQVGPGSAFAYADKNLGPCSIFMLLRSLRRHSRLWKDAESKSFLPPEKLRPKLLITITTIEIDG